jgi:hypothetical protein
MKTFREFISTCEGYVPLRTSDQPYDDEGFPTRTRSWSKKMTNARMNVGRQKFNSSIGVGDPINNLVKGVSAKTRLDAMKKVDDEPESVRAKRSQARSAANNRLGSQRRTLQTQMDRQNLNQQWRGRGGSGSLQGIRRTPEPESPAGLNFKPSYGRRFGISGIGLAD